MNTEADKCKIFLYDIPTLSNLLPEFNTTYPEQIYRFVRSCDSAFSLASPEQIPILLVYALNKIIGSGASEVHSRRFTNWQQLKKYLIQRFSTIKTIAHLNLELQSMFQKHNESITQYYDRVDLCRSKIIEKLTTEITDDSVEGRKIATDELALNVFVNGLNSEIGMMLRTNRFDNLPDAGRFAIQEDKIRAMNNARQALYKFNNYRTQNAPSNPPRGFVATPRSHFRQSNVPPALPRSTNDSNKICNYCKRQGHVIAECRRRAYNNSLRNQTIRNTTNNNNNNQINHLNSHTAVEPGSSTETDSAHSSMIQNPTQTLDLENLQISW